MPPMTERDQFIQNWEHEFNTTMKLLRAYPENQMELKPHERSRSARELAWVFNIEENTLIDGTIKGNIDWANMPKAPSTLKEILSTLESNHRRNVEKVRNMNDQDYNSTMKFFVGPGQTTDMRKADILWASVRDAIHHRGQFSVYLRMAGGKVPSIYGPSADEPWM